MRRPSYLPGDTGTFLPILNDGIFKYSIFNSTTKFKFSLSINVLPWQLLKNFFRREIPILFILDIYISVIIHIFVDF